MAIAEGICRNCGSMIMLENREESCECLFCNCVFPVSEALALAADSEGHVFPNEPLEKREDVRRLTVTPVFQDPVPAAVQRAEKTAAVQKEEKVEYEVSPDDVKMPVETLKKILVIAAAFVALVLVISLPLSISRIRHRNALSKDISTVFTEFSVNVEKEDGYFVGFYLNGQKNGEIAVVTGDKLTPEAVLQTFKNYAAFRGEEYGIPESSFNAYYSPISLSVYGQGESYFISVDSESELTAESVRKIG